MTYDLCRAVGRSKNPKLTVLFGGHYLPLLVEIGLTDLLKSWGGHMPWHPGTLKDVRPTMCCMMANFSLNRLRLQRRLLKIKCETKCL